MYNEVQRRSTGQASIFKQIDAQANALRERTLLGYFGAKERRDKHCGGLHERGKKYGLPECLLCRKAATQLAPTILSVLKALQLNSTLRRMPALRLGELSLSLISF